jgi:hypothetical protein
MSRVAPRQPAAHLDLVAPTPVSSVVSTPVRNMAVGDIVVGGALTSDAVASDALASDAVASDAVVSDDTVSTLEAALAEAPDARSISSAPCAEVLDGDVVEAPRHDSDGATCSGMPEAMVTLTPPPPLHRSPSEAPHRPNDVNDLLARFGSAPRRSDRELLRGLERLAGVDAARSPVRLESDTEERLHPSPVVAVR